MGVNYVFSKQDKNYAIQVHYFTTHDYHNKSYTKEVDDRIEDIIATMENKEYNWYISTFNKILNGEDINWKFLWVGVKNGKCKFKSWWKKIIIKKL